MLTPQEFREQADLCIDRARTAGSAAERKLYRRLALTWLEIVIRIEPRAIELRDGDMAAFTVRTCARAVISLEEPLEPAGRQRGVGVVF